MTVAANRSAGKQPEPELYAQPAPTRQGQGNEALPMPPTSRPFVAPLPGEPLRVLYICSQRPGYGGAATESYEAIKWLRRLGCHVEGRFIVGARELDACDPDGIGGVLGVHWGDTARAHHWAGPWHVVVGKNTWAPQVLAGHGMASVYVTSGVEAYAAGGVGGPPQQEGGPDRSAFEAATFVVVHSTLDLGVYRRCMPPGCLAKILPDVIRTSVLAARKPAGPLKPLRDRRWDLCFAASSWRRPTKGPDVAAALTDRLGGQFRIVACGEDFPGRKADLPGLVPHGHLIEILANSRVVAIPSRYDSSPNLYVEAIYAGCNVVVSPAIGNIEGHPPEFLAAAPKVDAFIGPIQAAAVADRQLDYRVEEPETVARQLIGWLRRIVEGKAGNL